MVAAWEGAALVERSENNDVKDPHQLWVPCNAVNRNSQIRPINAAKHWVFCKNNDGIPTDQCFPLPLLTLFHYRGLTDGVTPTSSMPYTTLGHFCRIAHIPSCVINYLTTAVVCWPTTLCSCRGFFRWRPVDTMVKDLLQRDLP